MNKYFVEFFEFSVFTKVTILFFVSYVLIRIAIFSFKIYKRKKSPIFSNIQEKYYAYKKKIEENDGLVYDGKTVEDTFNSVLKKVELSASKGKGVAYYTFISRYEILYLDKFSKNILKKHINRVISELNKNGFIVEAIADTYRIHRAVKISGWE